MWSTVRVLALPTNCSNGDGTVEILAELLKAAVTLGVIVLVALLMAALFIIVLSIATGIDRNIQTEEDRTP